jgi:hypothetical protein
MNRIGTVARTVLLCALGGARLAFAAAPDRIDADGFDGNDACIAPPGLTRLMHGTVTYTAQGGSHGRDLTLYTQVWGHNTASDAEAPWPGRQPSTPIITLPRYSYLSLRFTVPQDADPMIGMVARTTYSYGIDMTAAYSVRCGDFSPPEAACFAASDFATGPLPFPMWRTDAGGAQCHLVPGGTYYLNVMATDPTMSWAGCPANHPSCPMGTNNLFGPLAGYP